MHICSQKSAEYFSADWGTQLITIWRVYLMRKLCLAILGGFFVSGLSLSTFADSKPVGITDDIMSIPVMIDGMTVEFKRNQDNDATVNPAFAKTSRPCPPFCIQPSNLAFGVETIGEIELIDFAKEMNEGNSEIIVIDSRTPDWVARGTIPTAMNIPWTSLNPAKGATPLEIAEILETHFNVTESEGLFDFSQCRTAVMFCNGMWCGQSPNNIKNLLRLGYPSNKIKWYRGGMQDWEILGLTTVQSN